MGCSSVTQTQVSQLYRGLLNGASSPQCRNLCEEPAGVVRPRGFLTCGHNLHCFLAAKCVDCKGLYRDSIVCSPNSSRRHQPAKVLVSPGLSSRCGSRRALAIEATSLSTLNWLHPKLPPPHNKRRRVVVESALATMGYGSEQIGVALALTMVGGLATAAGGLLVVLQPAPNVGRLGIMQGLAAGLMLCLSFFDLLPEAIEKIGFKMANIWFFAGVLFFWAVVQFIPEPQLDELAATKKENREQELTSMPEEGQSEQNRLGLRHRPGDRPSETNLARPSPTPSELAKKGLAFNQRRVLYSGIITAVGISLHNFPEGIAVFLGSLKGLRVGVTLAVAIALHNIPEGVAVALPIYYGTGSRSKAFWLAAFSGLAEPLAVILVALFFPSSLSEETIEGLLAAVGGIMAFLVLHEMLPLAFEYAGHKPAVVSVFIGMALMSVSLWFLAITLPPELT